MPAVRQHSTSSTRKQDGQGMTVPVQALLAPASAQLHPAAVLQPLLPEVRGTVGSCGSGRARRMEVQQASSEPHEGLQRSHAERRWAAVPGGACSAAGRRLGWPRCQPRWGPSSCASLAPAPAAAPAQWLYACSTNDHGIKDDHVQSADYGAAMLLG